MSDEIRTEAVHAAQIINDAFDLDLSDARELKLAAAIQAFADAEIKRAAQKEMCRQIFHERNDVLT